MLQLVLSCFLLLSIVLWWAEAKYNFLHGIVMWFKDGCDWIKKQTKLKIDICKWFLPCIFIFGAIYTLYYPYFKQTLEFKQGAFVIKDYSEGSKDKESVQEKVPKNIENEEKANPIGDWGTFGDFIGGTLNPLIGLISVFLLFATWRLTSNTFKSTDSALKYQQFDSWFFNLLESFQSISSKYEEYVKEEDFYKKLFLEKQSNLTLSENILMMQYFTSLNVLLSLVNSKLDFIEEIEKFDDLKAFYVDIILSKISGDILQIIAWYAFHDDDLKVTLENSGFFKKIDFKYYVDRNSKILGDYNFELLSQLHRYDEKIFKGSKKYLDLKNTYLYEIFFGEELFIYKFFHKQYSSRVSLEIEGRVTKTSYELSLIFDETGVKYGEWDIARNGYAFQTMKYQNMIFNESNILVPLKSLKIVIPFGKLSKINITDTDELVLNALKID